MLERVWVVVALVAIVAAALAALPTTVMRIQRIVADHPPEGDYVTRFVDRLQPVREALLQRQLMRVGYLPRMAVRSSPMQMRGGAHFLWTRYALAPILLRPTWRESFVLADLRFEDDPAATMPDQLTVEKNFGDGLLLLRRRKPSALSIE